MNDHFTIDVIAKELKLLNGKFHQLDDVMM
jgi:hypothetical protein